MAYNHRFGRAGRSSTTELVDELLDLAVFAPRNHAPDAAELAVSQLCELDEHAVRREAERRVRRSVAGSWNGGWQPRELARQVRRRADAPTARLALVAIAVDHAGRAASTLDARWAAQLTELELPTVDAHNWFAEWGRREQLTWPEQLRSIVALLSGMVLPQIEILIPAPGAPNRRASIIDLVARADDPMLNRVRALLAQAESTNFEAEAETFTAKAQELMTRHAIDMAMVSATSHRSEHPGTIRIPIDDPYVAAKSLLLHVVAKSSRCRAVFHPGLALSSVVGFANDLNATETLFTSLLVQVQVALRAATRTASPGSRPRSRAFRSAFLMAYAHRVGERLEEINTRVVAVAVAETGRSIVPVLAARSVAVDAAVAEQFGRLRNTSARRYHDADGWASGRAAADLAKLSLGDAALPAPVPAG